MKYSKPVARNLSDLSMAEGFCSSGQFVGTCYQIFGLSAGDCHTGATAGLGCAVGNTPFDTCNYGAFGYYSGDCTRGGIAGGG